MDIHSANYSCPHCGKDLPFGSTGCICPEFKGEYNNSIWSVGDNFFHGHDVDKEKMLNLIASRVDLWPADSKIVKTFFYNYTLPMIQRLQSEGHKIDTVLSAGCGSAVEVELLRQHGYQAYGFDPGSRCASWHLRDASILSYLVHCDEHNAPFSENSFDLVLCQQVIEHIGVVGDSIEVMDSYNDIRHKFCQKLISFVRPDGLLQIATPNKYFPIDPGHKPNVWKVRIHSPWHRFLVSYAQMKQYFSPYTVIPLSPYGYYTQTGLENKFVAQFFNFYIKILSKSKSLISSPFNPLCNILVHKTINI